MKIIAVGRNYQDHAKELNNPIPKFPILFLKPDTALLKNNQPFFHPEYSQEIHHEIEIVVKISKEGKYIHRKFAHKYFEEIGLGIDFTARDLQQNLKAQGLPWEISKSFDHSAPISTFLSKYDFNLENTNFKLLVNNELRQIGNTQDMLFKIESIIEYASQFFTLKKGDLIFTGTPSGVGKIKIGDHLIGFIENYELLNFYVK